MKMPMKKISSGWFISAPEAEDSSFGFQKKGPNMKMPMKKISSGWFIVFVSTILGAKAAHAQGNVWVVDDDGGPGVDFMQIQTAVDAAASGDRIVVRAGQYAPFKIEYKALHVLGEGSSLVTVDPGPLSEKQVGLTISGAPASGEVVVSGMTVHAHGSGPWLLEPFKPIEFVPVIYIHNSLGRVFLNDVQVPASDYWVSEALSLFNAKLVVVTDSLLRGEEASYSLFSPGTVTKAGPAFGLGAVLSTLWVANSSIEGGWGAVMPDCAAFSGQTAISLALSTLYLADSLVSGGNGGTSGPCPSGIPLAGNGAPAVDSKLSTMKLVSGTLSGGSGGGASPCQGGAGAVGLNLNLGSFALLGSAALAQGGQGSCVPGQAAGVSGPHAQVATIYPTLAAAPSVVKPGSMLGISVAGAPGESAFVFLSEASGEPALFSGIDGAAILDLSTLHLLSAGTLGADGKMSLTLPVPTGTSWSGRAFFLQGLVGSALTNPVLVALSE